MFNTALKNSTGYKKLKVLQELDFVNAVLMAVEKAVKNNENVILDYNRNDQLYNKGEYPEGDKVKPSYTLRTIQIKKRKGQPTNRVTLKDKGDFYKRFDIVYFANGFQILSYDKKTSLLVKKYDKRIFGVSESNREAFAPFIIEAFKELLNNKL